jgi:hypothetical protein
MVGNFWLPHEDAIEFAHLEAILNSRVRARGTLVDNPGSVYRSGKIGPFGTKRVEEINGKVDEH